MSDFYIGDFEENELEIGKFKTDEGTVEIDGRKFEIDYRNHPANPILSNLRTFPIFEVWFANNPVIPSASARRFTTVGIKGALASVNIVCDIRSTITPSSIGVLCITGTAGSAALARKLLLRRLRL
ncbi:MAG: hypothetical protein GY753_05135 [Gammaproteobacteria bacterium]|nr:hypothetical protein [Gammaproteobacteria bacterium]